ncbi:protein kinase [uncultured Fibrella sp.]|uniref:protein kinase domain-containing protein n=1 Tax=uncultured Fibrella sp. TaxID=1284596 RepID=UPI0035CB48DF
MASERIDPIQEKYHLLSVINGGEAFVRKALDKKLHCIRAVRELHQPIPPKSLESQKQVLMRLSNSNHPNIAAIYALSDNGGRLSMEMEFIGDYKETSDGPRVEWGVNLNSLIQQETYLSAAETECVLRHAASALQYCHCDVLDLDYADGMRVKGRGGIIHNDLTAKNIMQRPTGEWVLIDFGLSFVDNDRRSSLRGAGTIEYMAPETFDDMVATTQSDIYSLGVVLYQCLTGEVPFPAKTGTTTERGKIQEKHAAAPVPPIWPTRAALITAKTGRQPNVPDYPAWLELVVMKCLAKKPAERYTNGKELAAFVASQQPPNTTDITRRMAEAVTQRETAQAEYKILKAYNGRLLNEQSELQKARKAAQDSLATLQQQLTSVQETLAIETAKAGTLQVANNTLQAQVANLTTERNKLKINREAELKPIRERNRLIQAGLGLTIAALLLYIWLRPQPKPTQVEQVVEPTQAVDSSATMAADSAAYSPADTARLPVADPLAEFPDSMRAIRDFPLLARRFNAAYDRSDFDAYTNWILYTAALNLPDVNPKKLRVRAANRLANELVPLLNDPETWAISANRAIARKATTNIMKLDSTNAQAQAWSRKLATYGAED